MTRSISPVHQQRLARWAEILEAQPQRWVRNFDLLAITNPAEDFLAALAGSALDLAAQDEGLRGQGLRDGTIGAAVDFFGLTPGELIIIVGVYEGADLRRAAEVAADIRLCAREAAGRYGLSRWASITAAFVVAALIWSSIGFGLSWLMPR